MARARAEVVKLEALEKIATARSHQLQLLRKQPARHRRSGSFQRRTAAVVGAPASGPRLPGQGVAAPHVAAAAANAALGTAESAQQAAEPPAEPTCETAAAGSPGAAGAEAAASAADGDEGEGSPTASGGISSATLELFSVVSRLRDAISESAGSDAATAAAAAATLAAAGIAPLTAAAAPRRSGPRSTTH